MMNFEEFVNALIEELSERLEDVSIEMHVVDKNNGTKLNGLIFKESTNISPIIYVDNYYEQYTKYYPLQNIVSEIEKAYLANKVNEDFEISLFTDYEKVKSNIIFELVNYAENKELLEKVPHVKYLDLAIIFKCLISKSGNEMAKILIHKSHLAFWEIGQNTLYRLAMENTPRLLEYKLENIGEVLGNMIEGELPYEEEMFLPLYVLSNYQKTNGAGCILYKDLLKIIAEKYQTDFYILPSSIHEVLLLPVDESREREELSSMVQEINNTQLCKEEILSDHVYYFSRETGKITM